MNLVRVLKRIAEKVMDNWTGDLTTDEMDFVESFELRDRFISNTEEIRLLEIVVRLL